VRVGIVCQLFKCECAERASRGGLLAVRTVAAVQVPFERRAEAVEEYVAFGKGSAADLCSQHETS
jgi:hypothetical protein